MNGLAYKLKLIWGIFFHPADTLATVSAKGDYLLPLIMLSLALAGLRLTMIPEVIKEFDSPEYIERYATERKITTENAVLELEKIKKGTPALLAAESPLLVITGIAGISLLLLAFGRISYEMRLPFKSLFAMVAWTSLVGIIPILAATLIKLMNYDFILPTNPALLLPAGMEESYWFRILGAFDLFLIWQVWLLSLGVARLYQVGLQRAVSLVGTIFIVLAALNAILSAVPLQ